jgi:hypothetical protein
VVYSRGRRAVFPRAIPLSFVSVAREKRPRSSGRRGLGLPPEARSRRRPHRRHISRSRKTALSVGASKVRGLQSGSPSVPRKARRGGSDECGKRYRGRVRPGTQSRRGCIARSGKARLPQGPPSSYPRLRPAADSDWRRAAVPRAEPRPWYTSSIRVQPIARGFLSWLALPLLRSRMPDSTRTEPNRYESPCAQGPIMTRRDRDASRLTRMRMPVLSSQGG